MKYEARQFGCHSRVAFHEALLFKSLLLVSVPRRHVHLDAVGLGIVRGAALLSPPRAHACALVALAVPALLLGTGRVLPRRPRPHRVVHAGEGPHVRVLQAGGG